MFGINVSLPAFVPRISAISFMPLIPRIPTIPTIPFMSAMQRRPNISDLSNIIIKKVETSLESLASPGRPLRLAAFALTAILVGYAIFKVFEPAIGNQQPPPDQEGGAGSAEEGAAPAELGNSTRYIPVESEVPRFPMNPDYRPQIQALSQIAPYQPVDRPSSAVLQTKPLHSLYPILEKSKNKASLPSVPLLEDLT